VSVILVTNRQYLQPMTLLDGDGPAESAEALCASKRVDPHLCESASTSYSAATPRS
jgi:hypothetical protein